MHSMGGGRRTRAARLVGAAGWMVAGLVASTSAFAQAQAVDAGDYARAETFLPHNTAPLVDHVPSQLAWLDDGQFVYRDHDAEGDRFLRVDAANGGVVPAFDHVKLARALGKAAGKPAKAGKLPLRQWSIDDEDRIALSAFDRDYRCDLSGKGTCVEKTGEPGVRAPDGAREALVRDWKRRVPDKATPAETQLTTHGAHEKG
jgi:hypothetical protein